MLREGGVILMKRLRLIVVLNLVNRKLQPYMDANSSNHHGRIDRPYTFNRPQAMRKPDPYFSGRKKTGVPKLGDAKASQLPAAFGARADDERHPLSREIKRLLIFAKEAEPLQ